MSFALTFSAISFLSSAIPSTTHSLEIGKEAPAFSLAVASAHSLSSLKGEYTIINFWSAHDVESRLKNRQLAGMTGADGSPVRMLSVCLDDDAQLASEIAAHDGFENHLMRSDLPESVLSDYQTSTGCRAFLLSPYGILEKIL